MKTKAAILWERNTPWSVEEIELDPPKTGEVLVKLAASGMCHSDEHIVTGDLAGPEREEVSRPPLAILPIPRDDDLRAGRRLVRQRYSRTRAAAVSSAPVLTLTPMQRTAGLVSCAASILRSMQSARPGSG